MKPRPDKKGKISLPYLEFISRNGFPRVSDEDTFLEKAKEEVMRRFDGRRWRREIALRVARLLGSLEMIKSGLLSGDEASLFKGELPYMIGDLLRGAEASESGRKNVEKRWEAKEAAKEQKKDDLRKWLKKHHIENPNHRYGQIVSRAEEKFGLTKNTVKKYTKDLKF